MHLLRVSGWVAVIIAAPAVLIIGLAAAHRASAPPRPARAGGIAPAVNSHPAVAGANAGGQGLSTGTGVAVDPAYFGQGACVAFPPVTGNRHLIVFLDAGHGGLDPGAVGVTGTGKVIDEADQTLPVVLDTTAILRREGFRVVVSRTGPTTVLRLAPGDVSGHLLTVTGAHDDVAARDVCADMAHADVLVGVYFNAGGADNAGCVTAYDPARPFAAGNLRLAHHKPIGAGSHSAGSRALRRRSGPDRPSDHAGYRQCRRSACDGTRRERHLPELLDLHAGAGRTRKCSQRDRGRAGILWSRAVLHGQLESGLLRCLRSTTRSPRTAPATARLTGGVLHTPSRGPPRARSAAPLGPYQP